MQRDGAGRRGAGGQDAVFDLVFDLGKPILVPLAALLALGPLLAVAVPAWVLWRLATSLLPRLPRWAPLVPLAGSVAGLALVATLDGRPLMAPVADYAGLQLELTSYLVAGALAAARGSPNPHGPWEAVGPRYLEAVVPTVLPLALVLAFGADAWLRRPARGTAPTPKEEHATGVDFPSAVVEKAEAGCVAYRIPRRVGPFTVGHRDLPGHPPDGFAIGWTRHGAPVAFRGEEALGHQLGSGVTRVGKTEEAKHCLVAMAPRPDRAVAFLDGKGSRGLASLVRDLGGEVVEPGGAVRYNPFAGPPSRVVRKLTATAGTVTGQQFNAATTGYCLRLVRALDAAGEARSLTRIEELLTPWALFDFIEQRVRPRAGADAAGELAGGVKRYLDDPGHDPRALSGLGDRLAAVAADEDVAALLTAAPAGPGVVTLIDRIARGGLVLFTVPIETMGLVGEKLAAWVLLDMHDASEALGRAGFAEAGKRAYLIVDEFSALGEQGRLAAGMLARAGEHGFAVWLLTQGLADLRLLNPTNTGMHKATVSRILQNTNLHVAFRHNDPEERELWSEHLGDYGTEEFDRPLDGETGAPTGNWRRKAIDRPYVAPRALKGLRRGEVYLDVNDRPDLPPFAVRISKAVPPPGCRLRMRPADDPIVARLLAAAARGSRRVPTEAPISPAPPEVAGPAGRLPAVDAAEGAPQHPRRPRSRTLLDLAEGEGDDPDGSA